MQSVPPRGSGWVQPKCGFKTSWRTHPLPRGGTDCIQLSFAWFILKGVTMNIPKSRLIPSVLFILILCGVSTAQTPNYPAPVEGDYVIKDFKFRSGESLPELRLHYRTIGTPQKDSAGVVRNAVLIMHGTGGTGSQFLSPQFAPVLFSAGKLLDGTKYFIILPDAIGHGGSSKPSDGLHTKFPHYTYDDMVLAQYRLITEKLGVNHLRLVMGTSMGGMQTWVWGEMYPDFMDALMPLASNPAEIAGRNRVWRFMAIDAIKNDPEWMGGEYKTQPMRALTTAEDLLMLAGSAPLNWQSVAPTREAAEKFYLDRFKTLVTRLDANDLIYQ